MPKTYPRPLSRVLRVPLPLMMSLFLLPALAHGTLWIVDPEGGGDFTEIQPAVEAAQTGDEVEVRPGTYEEFINYGGKEIRVYSSSGYAVTTIRPGTGPYRPGTGPYHTITFESGEGRAAVLEGFTVTGGIGRHMASLGGRSGGAIGCYDSDPTFRDCMFRENTADYGGAIALDGSNPLITGCLFVENVVENNGSAIAGPNSAPTIEECAFTDNEAPFGFGTVHLNAPAEMLGCTFFDNEARGAGAINLPDDGADMHITGCLFWANQSLSFHGGALRIHEADPVIESCTFIDNRAAIDGGAIMIQDGADAQVRHCTFYANLASRSGANFAIWDYSSPVIENCIMAEGLDGYGVFVENSAPIFLCTCSWNNRPDNFIAFPDPTGTDGNITVNPLFCGESSRDFTLHSLSECAEENNPECGQIGRYGVACGPTPSIETSWGEIKALFLSK